MPFPTPTWCLNTSPSGIFGILIPSTNTSVEAEFHRMLVPRISLHSGRIMIHNPSMSTDAEMTSFLASLRTELETTVKSLMTCKPSYLIMGMSAETFWGGVKGAEEFERWIAELSGGLGVTTGARAVEGALGRFGAKRLGVVTPYQKVGDEQVVSFFTEQGYTVSAIKGLRCANATVIAEVPPSELKAAFREVNSSDVDALVQAGTNLACAKVAAEMEVELGKPVIAINTATLWHAYRENGIMDKLEGWGRLFSEH